MDIRLTKKLHTHHKAIHYYYPLIAKGSTVFFLAFFMGRAMFYNGYNPFVASFIATLINHTSFFYIGIIGSILGITAKIKGTILIRYLGELLIIAIFREIIKRKQIPSIRKSTIALIAAFTPSFIYYALNGFLLFNLLSAFIVSTLVFFLAYIFENATNLLLSNKRKIVSNEEIISVSLLLAGAICGISDLYIGHFYLGMIISVYIILCLAYRGGSHYGSTTGIITGLSLMLSGNFTAPIISILSVSGLAAGIVSSLSKIGTLIGFFLSGVLVTFYLNYDLLNINFYTSVATGITLFIITPKKALEYIRPFNKVDNTLTNKQYLERIKHMANDKLACLSDSYKKLSKTLKEENKEPIIISPRDINKLVDKVAYRLCNKCKKYNYCLKTNFYNTYQTVFTILSTTEKNGEISLNDIPEDFKNTCTHLTEFIETVNAMFEVTKNNCIWQKKVKDYIDITAEQLLSVSDIVTNLSNDIDLSLNFKEDLEKAIEVALDKKGIGVFDIMVLENKKGKYEVCLNHMACYGRKKCISDIIKTVSAVLNRKMQKDVRLCNITGGKCTLKLIEEQKYKVTCGMAKENMTGNHISGDNHSFMEISNGKCIFALSDGMGKGERAGKESKNTIELLECFLEAGFSEDLAIKLINSLFLLRSNDDMFATLDICSLNLHTGDAEFAKIGACSTYILRGGEVIKIESTSLPVGLFKNIDIETTKMTLEQNDIVVMLTDGILDANPKYDDKWLIAALEAFPGTSPQDLSDYVLMIAKDNCNGNLPDDMCVLAGKMMTR